MAMEIIDGSGSGVRVKVGSDKRMWADTVQRGHNDQASLDGDSYNINTGVINLTSANKSAVLYVKNNESDDMIIENLFYLIGNSTGGSGDMLISVIRNPTTGTIIDNASAAEMAGINRNFGSSKTLTADIYKGAEGSTITNGTKLIESIVNQSATRIALSAGTIVLGKGNSIGFEITPGSGNTDLDVEFALAVHLETGL